MTALLILGIVAAAAIVVGFLHRAFLDREVFAAKRAEVRILTPEILAATRRAAIGLRNFSAGMATLAPVIRRANVSIGAFGVLLAEAVRKAEEELRRGRT